MTRELHCTPTTRDRHCTSTTREVHRTSTTRELHCTSTTRERHRTFVTQLYGGLQQYFEFSFGQHWDDPARATDHLVEAGELSDREDRLLTLTLRPVTLPRLVMLHWLLQWRLLLAFWCHRGRGVICAGAGGGGQLLGWLDRRLLGGRRGLLPPCLCVLGGVTATRRTTTHRDCHTGGGQGANDAALFDRAQGADGATLLDLG